MLPRSDVPFTCFVPISEHKSTLDLNESVCTTEVENIFCSIRMELLHKQAHFVLLGWKEKYIVNTNLFVKQVDSIAAKGSCIFLGVLLRDYFGSRHAVKIEIQ